MCNGFFLYILPGHFRFRFIRIATDCSFIRSQRGTNKLVSEGYIYKMDCVRGEKPYIQTADELSYTQEHNHCPDSAAIDIDIEKNISFHPFSRKVSVGECRRVSVSF